MELQIIKGRNTDLEVRSWLVVNALKILPTKHFTTKLVELNSHTVIINKNTASQSTF